MLCHSRAKKKIEDNQYSNDDYIVNMKNLIEEDRVITGIGDIYGKLFDELNLGSIFASPSANKSSGRFAYLTNTLNHNSSIHT